jgi:hypothetical protein
MKFQHRRAADPAGGASDERTPSTRGPWLPHAGPHLVFTRR